MKKTRKTDYHDFTTINTPKKERRRLNVGDIWINKVKCKKCNEEIRSKNLHDFKWCSCNNIAVDGGSWYAKRVGDVTGESYEELSVDYKNK